MVWTCFTASLPARKFVFTFIVVGVYFDFGESIYKIGFLHPLITTILRIVNFNNIVIDKRRNILHVFNVGLHDIHHMFSSGPLSPMKCEFNL